MRKILISLALVFMAGPALAAATPSPNLNDQAVLAADTLFQNRALESFFGFCANSIKGEGTTVAYHNQRSALCQQVLLAQATGTGSWKVVLAQVAAANATVVGDATAAGATPLTSANADAQQALVVDTDLNNALAAAFNEFLGQP
jgi:hypothetical protein